MPTLWLHKDTNGNLCPSSDEDAEYLKRFRPGDIFSADVTMKRNGKHHRLGMALLRFVFDNQDRYTNFESFLTEVKILTGHVETHISSDGQVFYKVKSIAFDTMDELAFSQWKKEALREVFEHFIPLMGPSDQVRVINNLIAQS